jgi:hypothetical protein
LTDSWTNNKKSDEVEVPLEEDQWDTIRSIHQKGYDALLIRERVERHAAAQAEFRRSQEQLRAQAEWRYANHLKQQALKRKLYPYKVAAWTVCAAATLAYLVGWLVECQCFKTTY